MTPSLAATFRKPFDEQLAAFRLRMGNLVATSAWDDLIHAQHDRAFMVAGAVKADLLADLAAAVERSIESGTGLEVFRKEFRSLVEKHGWHGWTGEGTAKGEAWRTKVIWRTNMATSYAAGRMAQLRDGQFKYWVYRHGGSLEPRLQHLAWDGVALSPDHPFWAEHYPPNGWGCSCRVFGTNSQAGIKRVGGDPAKELPDGWEEIDPKTGAPVGISKGWDYAPGASVATEVIRVVKAKTATLPEALGKPLSDAAQRASTTWLDPDDAERLLERIYAALDLEDDPADLASSVRAMAERISDGTLRVDQAMALNAYTRGEVYGPLNAMMRDQNRQGQSSFAGPEWAQLADLIDDALSRVAPKPGIVSRGVPEPGARLLEYFSKAEPGSQFSFAGFTSATEDFSRTFSGSLRFVIHGISGRNVTDYSAHSREQEVLFRPGTQFVVLARTGNSDQMTIWIEEVRPHRYLDLPEESLHAEQSV